MTNSIIDFLKVLCSLWGLLNVFVSVKIYILVFIFSTSKYDDSSCIELFYTSILEMKPPPTLDHV